MTPIEEIYEKIKHLDPIFHDLESTDFNPPDPLMGIAGDMYRAIKKELIQRGYIK